MTYPAPWTDKFKALRARRRNSEEGANVDVVIEADSNATTKKSA
jgi:hypothetical protein